MLEVLNPLAIKGLARPGDLAEATGLSERDVDARLTELAEAGLARLRGGRINRWTVTEDGRARRAELLRASVAESGAEREIESAYEAFLPVNGAFKALCTRWQSDRDAARAAVELAEVHGKVTAVLAGLARALPRFGRYELRLSAASQRFLDGQTGALTAPGQASYHDIWMELHADLLASLGRGRSAADG